jgi:hypothetical protein
MLFGRCCSVLLLLALLCGMYCRSEAIKNKANKRQRVLHVLGLKNVSDSALSAVMDAVSKLPPGTVFPDES